MADGISRSIPIRHNVRDVVSNHQPHDCLLNRVFRWRSKKTSKLRTTGLCAGNSPVTGEFPAQMASNAENVSIWWVIMIWHLLWSYEKCDFAAVTQTSVVYMDIIASTGTRDKNYYSFVVFTKICFRGESSQAWRHGCLYTKIPPMFWYGGQIYEKLRNCSLNCCTFVDYTVGLSYILNIPYGST